MNFQRNRNHTQLPMSLRWKRDKLYGYYRHIISSCGVVHVTLGLANLFFWAIVLDLFFDIKLTVAISFLLSGSISLTTRCFVHPYLIYIAVLLSFISSLTCLALFSSVFYVYTHENSSIFFNPISEIFLIFSIMGAVFSIIVVTYGYYAIQRSKKNLQINSGSTSEYSAPSTETRMTTASQYKMSQVTTVDIVNRNSNMENKESRATTSV